jgi:hypothetical protein
MRTILKIGLLIMVTICVAGCATTVRFQVVDADTYDELPDFTVDVEGRRLGPGGTISLSNLDWADYPYRVQADGYKPVNGDTTKEFKVGTFIGGLFIWPFWFWCYGPKALQTIVMQKISRSSAE